MKLELGNSSSIDSLSCNEVEPTSYKSVKALGCENVDTRFAKVVQISLPSQLKFAVPHDRPLIVVDDGTPLTTEICKTLGRNIVVLSYQGKPAVPRGVEVPDLSEEALVQALALIRSTYGVPIGIICQQVSNVSTKAQLCWALLAAKHLKKDLNAVLPNSRSFFVGVVRLNGRLGNFENTNDLSKFDWTKALDYGQRGSLLGLCKSLDLEWEQVFCRGIDLACDLMPVQAAKMLRNELQCPDLRLREVGYDISGARHTISTNDLLCGPSKAKVEAADLFLVTGGARGITPHCVREIARRSPGTAFVLVGRSEMSDEPDWAVGRYSRDLDRSTMKHLKATHAAGGLKPTPKAHRALVNRVTGSREIRESLKAIQDAGAIVEYIACDVSDENEVRQLVQRVEQKYRREITGIWHASGVLRDKLVEQKTTDDFEAVFGTKVTGLVNVMSQVNISKLRHLILFSSLAGFHGNKGQTDYAIANEALNKIAHILSAFLPKLNAKVLDFGPWVGSGMVTETLEKHFKAMGVQTIPLEPGARTVAQIILASSPPQSLLGNWGFPATKPLQRSNVVTRALSPEEIGFIADHKIQGRKVLPMMAAIGFMASIAEGIYPGYNLLGVEDAQLFQGLTVDQVTKFQITLIEEHNSEEKLDILTSLGVMLESGKVLPAYRCVVCLSTTQQQPRLSQNILNLEVDPACEVNPYDGKSLFHGPLLQFVEQVLHSSTKGLVAKCRALPIKEAIRGPFIKQTLHDPILDDVIFQLMLVWCRSALGSASLPNRIEKMSYFGNVSEGSTFFASVTCVGPRVPKDPVIKMQFLLQDESGNTFSSGEGSVVLSDGLVF